MQRFVTNNTLLSFVSPLYFGLFLFLLEEKKMIGFKTANSRYYVDLTEKKVVGGAIGNEFKEFEEAIIIVGRPAEFLFKDGGSMKTSTVQNYI